MLSRKESCDMPATIFYFSGTGNSYAIAKSIAEGLKGRLAPIAPLVNEDDIDVDTDSIGIVFPVFYTDVPNIVRVFISKLRGAFGSEDDSDMSLIYRLDSVFSVSEKRNGCGICSKVCPAGNIDMKNGKPEWTHHCENCLACCNFCPQKAISGISQKDYYYLNPG